MSSRQVPILFATFLLLCLPQAARSQGPPPGVGAATVITKAVADVTDPSMPQITIHGENLGTTPQVLLGDDMGAFVPLFVQSATDTLIVADLPVTIVPGSYMLIVEAAPGAANTGIIDR